MSKLKLIHGISKVHRAKLQVSIDQAIVDDLNLIAEWSNNETQYIINELLRYAIAQEEDFQKYKARIATSTATTSARPANAAKVSAPSPQTVTESTQKQTPTQL